MKMEINHGELNFEVNRFARKFRCNRGFTLVELLVVVAIISILAMTVMLGFADFMARTKISRCREEIRSLEKEIIAYSTDKAVYPPTLDDIGRHDLKDPWGGSYVYSPTAGTRHTGGAVPLNTDFDLFSKGPNGAYADLISDVDSEDDIIRAMDGSFCDVANRWAL